MMEFHAEDWYHITGRGWAATCKNPDRINPRPLVGQEVLIDGTRYLIKGVETFAVHDDHPAVRGPFSLLVGER